MRKSDIKKQCILSKKENQTSIFLKNENQLLNKLCAFLTAAEELSSERLCSIVLHTPNVSFFETNKNGFFCLVLTSYAAQNPI